MDYLDILDEQERSYEDLVMEAEARYEYEREEAQLKYLEEKEKEKMEKEINEVWADIKSYEGYYQVSNLGRIRTVKRNTKNQFKDKSLIRKLEQRNNGYLAVTLYRNNKSKKFNVHRLVAEAFITNENNYDYVNHINGNKQDNRVDNLEWCTASENIKHAIKEGLIDLRKNQKAVVQYDEDMKIIKEWDSIKEAEEVLGINHGNITEVCRGKNYRKHAGGFIWKYKEVI